MTKTVYLSGASKNVSDQGKGWRNYAEQKLMDCGWDAFNPISHYNYDTLQPESDRACMRLFFNRLKTCDVMLLNLEHSENSCGTAMEIGYALAKGLPIVAYGNVDAYNWSIESADIILDNIDEALQYIILHY